jgi:hypothetical protein
MPRYVIERTFDVDEEVMPSVGRRSKELVVEQFPEIVWEHSHVVVDDDGTLKSFCIYEAPDVATIRRHGELLGSHRIDHVYEIGGDITPDDFPLSAEPGPISDLDPANQEADAIRGGAPGTYPGELS